MESLIFINVEIVALVMEIPALVVTVKPGKMIGIMGKVVVPPVQTAASKTKILVKTLF